MDNDGHILNKYLLDKEIEPWKTALALKTELSRVQHTCGVDEGIALGFSHEEDVGVGQAAFLALNDIGESFLAAHTRFHCQVVQSRF